MSQTLAELEEILGPREDFLLSSADIPVLRQWALAKGLHPFSVNNMSGVELTNLYHDGGQKDTVHDAIIRVLEAVNAPGFEVSLTRKIAREEMRKEIITGDAIRKLLEDLAPRQLQVVTPQSNIVLDGYQHYMTEKIIRVIGIGHNVMMVGPAGCGKTFIGQQAARALNLPFYITSTVNDTHEIMGFVDGYGKYHATPFRHAFEHGGVWIADEIDAWDASALLAANSALANGYANFPDSTAPISRNNAFRMVATANTFGNGADRIYIGRNELDAASLDRFAVINVDYDLNLERMFANGNAEWLEYVWKVRKRVQEKKIRHVVSSRAITNGSQGLAAGLSWDDVCDIYLFKGMSATDRAKVTE